MIIRKTFTMMSIVKPGNTSIPLKHCRCWYVTKKQKGLDIIRWNAENKLLFGSKLKTSGSKKAAKVPKKTKSGQDASKMEDSSARAVQHRLEEMSMTHGGIDAIDYVQEDKLHQESGRSFGSSSNFLADYTSASKSKVDIPQILPIPKGKDTANKSSESVKSGQKMASFEARHNSKQSIKIKSTEQGDLPELKEARFILQCPLLPSQSQQVLTPAENFSTFVETLNMRFLPTVNTILNKTRSDLSNFFLQRWREQMIKELGEAGFKRHQEGIIWQGTNLHACIQQYLSGVSLAEIDIQENNRGHWDSVASVLPEVTEVQALETSVSHPQLFYKGTFDCVAKYKNVLYVIDWKTSSKPKPLLSNLYDNPLQVVAYLGAINHSKGLTSQFGLIENAAIVIAYHNGETAHVHKLKPALCQHYWNQWCQRLHQYWTMVAAEKVAKV